MAAREAEPRSLSQPAPLPAGEGTQPIVGTATFVPSAEGGAEKRLLLKWMARAFLIVAALLLVLNVYWYFDKILLRCNSCKWDLTSGQHWVIEHRSGYQDPLTYQPPTPTAQPADLQVGEISAVDIIGAIWSAIGFLIRGLIYVVWDVLLFCFFTLTVPLYASATIYALIAAGLSGTEAALDHAEAERIAKLARSRPAVANPRFAPLNRAGRESPLGEAGFAQSDEVSAALRGEMNEAGPPPPVFED
jgi:hypothetical protein